MALTITRFTPADGSTKVPTTQVIEIEFSKALDTSTVSAYHVSLMAGHDSVPIQLSFSEDARVVYVTPTVGLLPGTEYTLRVVDKDFLGSSILSTDGEALDGVYSVTFTTVDSTKIETSFLEMDASISTDSRPVEIPGITDKFQIVDSNPSPGSETSGTITFGFTENLSVGNDWNTLVEVEVEDASGAPADVTFNVSASGKQLVISLVAEELPKNHIVVVRLYGSIESESGKKLYDDYEWVYFTPIEPKPFSFMRLKNRLGSLADMVDAYTMRLAYLDALDILVSKGVVPANPTTFTPTTRRLLLLSTLYVILERLVREKAIRAGDSESVGGIRISRGSVNTKALDNLKAELEEEIRSINPKAYAAVARANYVKFWRTASPRGGKVWI